MQRKEDPTPAPFIEWTVDCDPCDASFAECVARLPPSRVYTLYCGKKAFNDIRAWMRNTSADLQRNPFAPQVNVCVEPMAKDHEWVIESGGKRVGSHGIPY
jgi:hypothetical protein